MGQDVCAPFVMVGTLQHIMLSLFHFYFVQFAIFKCNIPIFCLEVELSCMRHFQLRLLSNGIHISFPS